MLNVQLYQCLCHILYIYIDFYRGLLLCIEYTDRRDQRIISNLIKYRNLLTLKSLLSDVLTNRKNTHISQPSHIPKGTSPSLSPKPSSEACMDIIYHILCHLSPPKGTLRETKWCRVRS